jgi:MFS family permease
LGFILSGISSACIVVPSISELINILKSLDTDENSVNDMASSIWNLANYIGEALGPFIGGAITSSYSFNDSCIAISFINLAFGGAYYIFNKVYIQKNIMEYIQNSKAIKDNLDNKDINTPLFDEKLYNKRYNGADFSMVDLMKK